MNESERIRVLNTLAVHIANDTTVDAGGIMRVPMSDFTCKQLLAREQDVFFRRTPLCMGLSSALPEPNTYWSDNSTGIPDDTYVIHQAQHKKILLGSHNDF